MTNPNELQLLAFGFSGGTVKPWLVDKDGLWVQDYPSATTFNLGGASGVGGVILPSEKVVGAFNTSGPTFYVHNWETGAVVSVPMTYSSLLGGVTYDQWQGHRVWDDRDNGFFRHISVARDSSGGNQKYLVTRQIDPDGTVTILDETASGFTVNLFNATPNQWGKSEVIVDWGAAPDRYLYDYVNFTYTNFPSAGSTSSPAGDGRYMPFTNGAGEYGYDGGYSFTTCRQVYNNFTGFVPQVTRALANPMDIATWHQSTTPDGTQLTQSGQNFDGTGAFWSKPGALTEEWDGGGPPFYVDQASVIVEKPPVSSAYSGEPVQVIYRIS